MSPGRWQCPCFQAESEEVVVLEYSHCNLDDVPSEVFTFERTLEELYLDANQIKDLPRALFHCHGLRKLVLSDNEVQSLPPAIASLINLEELDVSKNGVLEIPDNIKGCKCLSIIEASVNPLGRLPEGFTQLANLSELYLNDTFLEYLPANFGRLCHLRILELRENHLKVLPKSMARLTELSRLDIGQNDFAELPEVIGSLQKLVELWCDGNRILRIPPHLGHLKKLSYLDASKNRIQEVSPEIDGCLSMTDLTLSSNKIKHLPHTIGNLKKLLVLRVDNNHLGNLPPSLGNLQLLEELVVSFNVLNSIPASLGLLRLLHTLIADDNCLEELPQEIGSCISLSILSVRNNHLSLVPDELGHIGRLRVVNLVGNRLCHLPFSIAKLPCLHALWLAENQAKPLIPLQSDIDQASGQRVLTCFMLPQSPVDRDGEPTTPDSEAEREVRQQIKFASDIESDRPGKLVRAPTPYPKELKAHARHARNFVLKKLEANGALPLDKSMAMSDVEETPVVTPNERCAVREAKVTKSPKEAKSAAKELGLALPNPVLSQQKETAKPTEPNHNTVNTTQLDAMEDMLQSESICCNGGVLGSRGSIPVGGAPMAALDSSPSPSPQSHVDNRVVYANTCARRASSDLDSSRPQSRCDPPVGGVVVLPSVHGQQQQTSPDSDTSSLTVQGHPGVIPGGQRSPRSSVASSPHGSLTPGSNGMTISSASGSCRVSISSNNPYSGCMSPQSGGESSDVSHYGSSSSGRTPQQGSVPNRMMACSGIAWYTEPLPMHHIQGAPLMHHQHAHHHLRQGQPQGEPMRPYSRGSYSETGYSALSRGEGGPRGGSPVNVVQHTMQGGRWGGPNPTEKRNSFPLARQNSADIQVAPLHHLPPSSHPPPSAVDPYRSGSRGSSRSSSPLTPFPHHTQQQQTPYGAEMRASPPLLENPLPLPPKPLRQMANDSCRTLPHLPSRAQLQQPHNSLNRQCLRSGPPESYQYRHLQQQQQPYPYPQAYPQQWRGSPVMADGSSPDVNLNPWPHPHSEEEEDAEALTMASATPPHGVSQHHWRFTQHHSHPLVFPVLLERNGSAPDQLGFRIEGGAGTPRNRTRPDDQNFYVSQVLEKSPASAALQPGDRILQVNGVDLGGLDQVQALDTIRSAGPNLQLLICRAR